MGCKTYVHQERTNVCGNKNLYLGKEYYLLLDFYDNTTHACLYSHIPYGIDLI